MNKINWYEITELVANILTDNDEEKAEQLIDADEVENLFYEKYDIDIEQFQTIVELILPYTPLMESPLTKELYHTLGLHDERGFRAIIKQEIK